MTQKKARLLVVTQDSNIHNLIETLIEHQRVQGIIFDSVRGAAQFLQHGERPDVLVLDLCMPENAALVFLQQMRNRDAFKQLPVLVLTDFPDPDEVRTALETGANRYLTKLFINKNLLSTIDEMIV